MKIVIYMLALLIADSGIAQTIPHSLMGNWLKTDGSNEPLLAIYPTVVVYNNECCTINKCLITDSTILISINYKNELLWLNLKTSAYASIALRQNSKCIPLKKIRTFNALYKPLIRNEFSMNFGETGMVDLKGLLTSSKELPYYKKNIITISYQNVFTGEKEFYHSLVDSNGIFKITFPVLKTQVCILTTPQGQTYELLARPGKELITIINEDIAAPNKDNPDFDQLLQRICFMGTTGFHANTYQQYLHYLRPQGYPQFNFPKTTISGKKVAEKKIKQKEYYLNLYARQAEAIGKLYTPAKIDSLFSSFLQNDLKYKIAKAALENFTDEYKEPDYVNYKKDTSDLEFIFHNFLKDAGEDALQFDAFYEAVNRYTSDINSIKYSQFSYGGASLEERKKRIHEEYGSLLPKKKLQLYDTLQVNVYTLERMREEDLIKKYFNNNKQEALEYKYLFEKINKQFFWEGYDVAKYEKYQKDFATTFTRFAANLHQLQEGYFRDDDKFVSIYRLRLFKKYSPQSFKALKIVDSVLEKKIIHVGVAGLHARFDSTKMKIIDNEHSWQYELKKLRGKIIVLAMFRGAFDRVSVLQQLFSFKQLKNKYKDSTNIIFLKGLQKRDREDADTHLLSHLQVFDSENELNHIFYFNDYISTLSAIDQAKIENLYCIYNTEGYIHNPGDYNSFTYEEREKWAADINREIANVQLGKGIYFEPIAGYFLFKNPYSDFFSTRKNYEQTKENSWTLLKQSGNYYSYLYGTPNNPTIEHQYDSVLQNISFREDSVYMSYTTILHETNIKKGRNDYFSELVCKKEFLVPDKNEYTYTFNGKERIISILNKKRKLVEKYKIAFINKQLMVLELLK